MNKLKIGVIKEGKTPPDARVPFSPEQAKYISDNFPIEMVIQSSKIRCFTDEEYTQLGLRVNDNVSECDILMGVKEVPMEELIPNKTYFFFSHTIKKQPYNRDLLKTILKKNIRLIDYECLAKNGGRILGFGRYAGIVGCYNGFRAYGLRYKLFDLKPAHQCFDQKEMLEELDKVKLDSAFPLRIALTGDGRVAHGAMEILNHLNVPKLSPEDYLKYNKKGMVYTQLRVSDYNKRKDGKPADMHEFFKDPSGYESNFMPFAAHTDMYIACHYWKKGSPYIFSRQDAKNPTFKIKVVADISCDIDGPVASTLRPSTIENPFYGYDPFTESETGFDDAKGITVMAVDNLPCELPKDASADFGNEFIKNVLPSILDDRENILKNATIAQNGQLTEKFLYLSDYVAE